MKPGVSSDWILNHVRAGQEVVTAELAAAGFKKVEEIDLLKDNPNPKPGVRRIFNQERKRAGVRRRDLLRDGWTGFRSFG